MQRMMQKKCPALMKAVGAEDAVVGDDDVVVSPTKSPYGNWWGGRGDASL